MEKRKKPIIVGAVHLPYYGRFAPAQSIAEIEEYALLNVRTFVENGIQSVYIQDENLWNRKATCETVSLMASLGRLLKREIPDLDLGIIIQAHDGVAPLAIAKACGASFVRIKVFVGAMLKAEGMINGCANEAVQYRTEIGADNVKIFADVHDRMGYPMQSVPIEEAAGWAVNAGADTLILTGKTFRESLELNDRVCSKGIGTPHIIGGSVTEKNIVEVLEHCDGAVVSSSLMLDKPKDSAPLLRWDAEKIRSFMDIVENAYV